MTKEADLNKATWQWHAELARLASTIPIDTNTLREQIERLLSNGR